MNMVTFQRLLMEMAAQALQLAQASGWIEWKKGTVSTARELHQRALSIDSSGESAARCLEVQKNVFRVYPKRTWFNSSNYKPLNASMHGAQMVAFNMQVCFSFLSFSCCD